MATVNLGSIKFNWRGAYNGATAYSVDDVISYQGSSFVCILASTGNVPTNTTYWNVFAEGGDVATTLTTQGDVLYRDGSGLQRLAAGTNGHFLKTQGSGANPVWAAAGGGMIAMQVFATAGSHTYTKSATTTKIKVIVTGGGGGGGGGENNWNSMSGGGAGGTAIKFITSGIGATESVTVGAGGSGASGGSSGTTGSAGGTSSFGSHCSATGGHAGNATQPNSITSGVGSGGDINITGGAAQGFQGGDGTSDQAGGSIGGASFWGGGGMVGNNGGTIAGGSGQAYGSGGGAGDHDGGSNYGGGGAGKSGIVVVEEYA